MDNETNSLSTFHLGDKNERSIPVTGLSMVVITGSFFPADLTKVDEENSQCPTPSNIFLTP
jgi:hypothetical protein